MTRLSRGISRPFVLRFLGTVLSLALLIYLLSRQGWREVARAVAGIPPDVLLVFLILSVLSRLLVGGRWYSLLRSADPSIPFLQSLRLTFAGLFAANFLPTSVGGDVVRLAGIVQLSQDRLGAASSIVADRIVGLIGMAAALPLGWPGLQAWVGLGALGGTLGSHFWGGGLLAVVPATRRERIRARVDRLARGIREALGVWIRRPRAFLTALAFTWLHMICLFSLIYLLLSQMGESISFLMVAGLWSFSYLINLMPLSINGWGLREVSVTFMYSELGGVSIQSALAMALLVRTFDVLVSLPGAVFVPGILAGRKTQRGPA